MAFSRPLTSGEIALARKTFGNSIDYTTVKIHNHPFMPLQPQESGMTPNGEIYIRGCYSKDYAAEDISLRGFFLHEMTHVWQYQNKILHPVLAAAELNLKHKFNYAASYDFLLDSKKDFINYGMEQQAAIIQQYYLLRNGGAN